MHRINLDNNLIRTDLLLEQKPSKKNLKKETYKDIKIVTTTSNNHDYTTIYFNDITDANSYYNLEKVFINELSKYIKLVN